MSVEPPDDLDPGQDNLIERGLPAKARWLLLAAITSVTLTVFLSILLLALPNQEDQISGVTPTPTEKAVQLPVPSPTTSPSPTPSPTAIPPTPSATPLPPSPTATPLPTTPTPIPPEPISTIEAQISHELGAIRWWCIEDDEMWSGLILSRDGEIEFFPSPASYVAAPQWCRMWLVGVITKTFGVPLLLR